MTCLHNSKHNSYLNLKQWLVPASTNMAAVQCNDNQLSTVDGKDMNIQSSLHVCTCLIMSLTIEVGGHMVK